MKKKIKIISLFAVSGLFIFMALASGGNGLADNQTKVGNEIIDDFQINGSSASFTYNVGYMYTVSYCGIGVDIWSILKEYPNVDNIKILVVEKSEDSYGKKNTTKTVINLDSNWIRENEVSKYEDSDSFCNFAQNSGIFLPYWTPKGNYE